MRSDTIAAIATGLSAAGISVIRLSGPEAAEIASGLFRAGKNASEVPDISSYESHTVHYGYIVDGERIVDEVMLLWLKAPKTYTREDTVEIDCHGGIVVTKRILSLLLRNGARLAEPGEFTKRAFLNGRIDLTEAEAVMGVIAAGNDLALRNSVKQLRGTLRTRIFAIREAVLKDASEIEAALDQPEYYSLEHFREGLSSRVSAYSDEIRALIRSADEGRLMKEGIRTVILGKPNVGKSSLMNALLEEERAIVTDVAGTTRDTLSEELRINGIPLVLTDTAGIHETVDPVEQIGVTRAREQAAEADLILFVADASTALSPSDSEALSHCGDAKVIALLNKSDLPPVTGEASLRELVTRYAPDASVLSVSAKDGTGLNKLRERISELFFAGSLSMDSEVAITSERQKECLTEALTSLENVLSAIEADMPEDIYSVDLMGAYAALSRILGEEVDEDLIDRIFADFCLGK